MAADHHLPRAFVALETSSAAGAVCLGIEDRILETRSFSGPRRHAQELLKTLDQLTRDHRLLPNRFAGIALSIGPGSFTGLRIATTAARALSLAVGTRIVAVPTLAVIAQNALKSQSPPRSIGVILDAKRGHVYAAAFRLEGHSCTALTDPAEHEPGAFLRTLEADAAVIGEGIAYHRDPVAASGLRVLPEELWAPRAEIVYELGWQFLLAGRTTSRRELVPTYLRPPEAEEKYRLRHPELTRPN